jgi:hypothetical protein
LEDKAEIDISTPTICIVCWESKLSLSCDFSQKFTIRRP